MTDQKQMPAGKAGKRELTHAEILTQNWQSKLATGNASYSRNGNYWHEASPRRKRRMIERAMRKAGANHG